MDVRKSEARFNSDALQVDGASLIFDPSRLPDYVEKDPEINRLWKAYQFFPYLDNNGRKVAYIFANGKKSYMRIGNFYIEPLLHVYDKESQANKRIVQLTQANYPYPIFMEWISAEMITLQTFRKRLWEEGDINFQMGIKTIWILSWIVGLANLKNASSFACSVGMMKVSLLSVMRLYMR
ncbi:MAG: hypothetical protein LUH63_12490 [Parabacteroides sp.]|nr:hypothetical protein [Parabacteroides sp.]